MSYNLRSTWTQSTACLAFPPYELVPLVASSDACRRAVSPRYVYDVKVNTCLINNCQGKLVHLMHSREVQMKDLEHPGLKCFENNNSWFLNQTTILHRRGNCDIDECLRLPKILVINLFIALSLARLVHR